MDERERELMIEEVAAGLRERGVSAEDAMKAARASVSMHGDLNIPETERPKDVDDGSGRPK